MLQVTYIHHSSFLVETDSAYLLFDYYQGRIPALKPDKKLYVFASHAHYDHYSTKIYQIAHKHATYLLSHDIPHRIPQGIKAKFLSPHVQYRDKHITVSTYESNDEGIAFWCVIDGLQIYHAGDLNDWDWPGEDEEWLNWQHQLYLKELKAMPSHADLAFVPLDGRLEGNYASGVKYFLKQHDTTYLFPMHFFNNYGVISDLKSDPDMKIFQTQIMEISHDGQTFHLKDS